MWAHNEVVDAHSGNFSMKPIPQAQITLMLGAVQFV